MKKDNLIIKEDRLSELPEHIVENILLGLDSAKERVRVSVLSKRWCALTTCTPYMDFNLNEFVKGVDGTSYHGVARCLFYKYIEHSVSRFFRQQDLSVHTFKLCTFFKDNEEVGVINKCLELILQKGVKVLDIDIDGIWYCPPIGRSSSLSKLTSLKMSGIVWPLSLNHDDDAGTFKNLKVLYLNKVLLDPGVIERLTVTCRLLEALTVEFCSGLKFVHLGLQNLKQLGFRNNHGVEEIHLKAPNLSKCHLFLIHLEGKGAPSMNLGSCKQLRTLHLGGCPFMTSKELSDFLSNSLKQSNFPFLENLSVCLRTRQDNPELSGPLRKPVLDTKGIRSQPYELVHFQLELQTIKDISVVDAVLFFCRPGSLTIVSNFDSIDYTEQGCVVKCIYDKLLQQEHQGHTSIRIEWFDFEYRSNSMLTMFSDHQLRETVMFIKEEVLQEEENNEPVVEGVELLRLLDNALNLSN